MRVFSRKQEHQHKNELQLGDNEPTKKKTLQKLEKMHIVEWFNDNNSCVHIMMR